MGGISWDDYFMDLAQIVKEKSKDPRVKVGAVLVSNKDHRIVSTGYNGLKSGIDESVLDWTNRDQVKDLIIHAEENAILYARGDYSDSTLYITTSPCCSCIRLISAVNITRIIYEDSYKDILKSKELAKIFGIEFNRIQKNL